MRVVLADDQVWLRSALRFLLEHVTNMEVLAEAGNIQTLLALLVYLHPDLLFLDWQLPGLITEDARQHLIE